MEFIQKYSGLIALAIFLIVGILLLIYAPEETEEEIEEEKKETIATPLNIDDEDATVACLVAAIECRNEYHKNVQIISVREVK